MAEKKAKDAALARRRRGITRASITRLEEWIVKIEEKDKVKDSDLPSVRRLIKRLETLDAEFKEYHFLFVEGMDEEEGRLDDEQIVLDEHDDKITDFTDRLLRLEAAAK